MKSTFLLFRHYLLLLNFVALVFTARSQDPPCLSAPTSGQKVLNIDKKGKDILNWNHPRNGQNPDHGKYSLWLEKGDGNYVSDFTGPSGQIISIPYNDLIYNPLIIATKLYEPQNHPPSSSGTSGSYNLSKNLTISQKMESPILVNKNIILFSNLGEVVAGDQMVFAISYQLNTDSRYKIVFRYNNNHLNTFKAITTISQTSGVADNSSSGPIPLLDIRKFDDEQIVIGNNLNRADYSDSIEFTNYNKLKGSKIKNIFISLTPTDYIIVDSSFKLEAEIYIQNNGVWDSLETSVLQLPGANAHDPNSINVSPKCLPLPQTKQILHYTINFQNDGFGTANAMTAVFNCPNQTNWSTLLSILKSSCNGIPITPSFDLDQARGKIVFKMDKIRLQGFHFPYTSNSDASKGLINFDLEIFPGIDPFKPDILESSAEIYLLSEVTDIGALRKLNNPLPFNLVNDSMINAGLFYPGTFGFELPVRTNNAISVFSKCCTDTDNCNCKHPRGFWQWLQCYWWILVIILLLIVIWWLYRNRHHH